MAQLAQDRSSSQMRNEQARVSYPADWYIEDDESMPQSTRHDDHEDRLKSILRAWTARTGRKLLVGCELAFRWDEKEPRVGVDPDVFVVEEPPREANGDIYSVRTWERGHVPPMLAIEIVSRQRPKKDYSQSPAKHGSLGTFELWVFDPDLHGHSEQQSSVRLQIYQRETNARLAQTYAGEGPVFSDALEAWVSVIDDQIVISNDPEGIDRWPTLEEAERRRADNAEAEKAKALAHIAELKALLASKQ